MRYVSLVIVLIAGCGEPTRYPARPLHYEGPSTGLIASEAELYCGRAPTDVLMNLTLVNDRHEPVEVFTVDANCNEAHQASMQQGQILTLASISTEYAFSVYNDEEYRVFSFILPPDTTEANQVIQ